MYRAKRFLIINTFGIGDVLFTVPLIKNIKANIPDAYIGYISNRRTAPLLESLPQINQVIVYDRNEFKVVSDRSRLEFLQLILKTKTEIQQGHYDIVFDFSMTWYAGFYCWLAGIKQRVGLNYKNRSIFLTKKVLFSGYEGRHVAQYYQGLLGAVNFHISPQSMDIAVAPEGCLWAEKFLQDANFLQARWIAVFPGGGESWGPDAKFKRWPAEKYAQLITKIMADFNVNIILLGNHAEESLCKEIQSLVKCPLFNACGKTNLLQTLAILKKSFLALVNDGGPLHMAVAAGIKTVSVFGPVDEKVYGPYAGVPGQHRVVTSSIACRPCYRNFRRAACEHISCVKNVEVGDVFNAVQNSLT